MYLMRYSFGTLCRYCANTSHETFDTGIRTTG